MGSMADYETAVARSREALAIDPEPGDLVRFATLAANSHNTQPWKFALADSSVSMLPDGDRRTPVVDPDDHHLYASLGCAAENLVVAAAARGRSKRLPQSTPSELHQCTGSLRGRWESVEAERISLSALAWRRQCPSRCEGPLKMYWRKEPPWTG